MKITIDPKFNIHDFVYEIELVRFSKELKFYVKGLGYIDSITIRKNDDSGFDISYLTNRGIRFRGDDAFIFNSREEASQRAEFYKSLGESKAH